MTCTSTRNLSHKNVLLKKILGRTLIDFFHLQNTKCMPNQTKFHSIINLIPWLTKELLLWNMWRPVMWFWYYLIIITKLASETVWWWLGSKLNTSQNLHGSLSASVQCEWESKNVMIYEQEVDIKPSPHTKLLSKSLFTNQFCVHY